MMDEEISYNGQEYRTGNTYQNKKTGALQSIHTTNCLSTNKYTFH